MTITEVVTFETMDCGQCGVIYALTAEYVARRRKDHASFHCPNGHGAHYPQLNREEELKKQLDDTQDALAAARRAQASVNRELEKAKKEAERLAKRAQNGVCSQCHRHFVNVERHMKTRHPA
jgi:hypothetical protein